MIATGLRVSSAGTGEGQAESNHQTTDFLPLIGQYATQDNR
jgi:hypothetical protein